MELRPGALKAMSVFGAIEHATFQGATTAQIWDAFREANAKLEFPVTGVGALDIGQLRSIAAATRNAMQTIQSLPLSTSITDVPIVESASARGLSEQNALGMWQVRYEHTVVEEGQQMTVWRTSVFEGGLPPTLGALMDAVGEDAQAVADSHGTAHVGVGAIQILAV